MPVYLPIAEMSINAGLIVWLGILVGFFSGLFGVGGGFLTTPLLMFLGIPPSIAAASQTLQIVASSSAGTLSQLSRKGVDFAIARDLLIGGAAGSVVGLGIFKILKIFGQIDLAIALLYTIMLGTIGSIMMFDTVRALMSKRKKASREDNPVFLWLKTLPYQTEYKRSEIRISRLGPMLIGTLSGLMITIMGVGAGFMVVPAMIYFLGMPGLLVTGTSLFQLLVLAGLAAIMHSVTTQSVDLVLALFLILGGVVGTILGLRATRFIKGMPARFILAILILLVAVRMGSILLVPPSYPFSITVDGL